MAGKTGKAAILWRASLLALIGAVLVIAGYQVELNRYSVPRVVDKRLMRKTGPQVPGQADRGGKERGEEGQPEVTSNKVNSLS